MGRPKSLRSRDIVPSIAESSTAATAGKKRHITFDDQDDDNQEPSQADEIQIIQSHTSKQKHLISNDIDVPEEVKSDSIEILKMRELHESMSMSLRRKSKRKRSIEAAEINKLATIDADKELDPSILEHMDEEDDGGLEEGHRQPADFEGYDNYEAFGWKIDTNKSNSRKIGHLEVTTLENNGSADDNGGGIENFEISEKVRSFQAGHFAANKRVSYSAFLGQKIKRIAKKGRQGSVAVGGGGGRPAKLFCVSKRKY